MQRNWFAFSALLAAVVGLAHGSPSGAKPADLPANNQIECPDGSDDPVQPGKFSIEVGFDLFSRSVIVKVGLSTSAVPTNIDAVCPAIISAYLQQILAQANDVIAEANRLRAEANVLEQARTIDTQLLEPINVRIDQVPLKNAIKNLAQISGLPMALDYKALRNAHINLDAPVTLKVQGTTAHKALNQFLADLGLVYVIEDGVVLITTADCGSTPRLSNEQKLAAANDKLAQRLFESGERCRRDGDYERARICFQQVHILAPTTLYGRVAIVRIAQIEERMRDASEEQGIPGRSDDEEYSFRRMRERTVPLGLVELSF